MRPKPVGEREKKEEWAGTEGGTLSAEGNSSPRKREVLGGGRSRKFRLREHEPEFGKRKKSRKKKQFRALTLKAPKERGKELQKKLEKRALRGGPRSKFTKVQRERSCPEFNLFGGKREK